MSSDSAPTQPATASPQTGADDAEAVFAGHLPVGGDAGTRTVTLNGEPLSRRYDLLSASPRGFDWGRSASGSAQLAVAMLAAAYGDDFASAYYQPFLETVISQLEREQEWTLTKGELDTWREIHADD